MARGAAVLDHLAGARGILFPWVPVCLGVGIGLWFAAGVEPGLPHLGAAAVLALACLVAWVMADLRWRPLWIAVGMMATGFALAGARGTSVAAPVLDGRYYGPVEGRIVSIDRSSSDKLRLTLDRLVLEGKGPAVTPALIRVSLQGAQAFVVPEPGLRVALTAHLAPPQGPAEPGDFDFRRLAWFERLGGVGYTSTPILRVAPVEDGEIGVRLHRLRLWLSAAVRARIDGDAGGYAAAVMTGDRSGLSAAANQVMRDSNLYHLVSISGMHMGMLAAFVFALVRYGFALVPPVALRLPTKKIAAAVALVAAAGYLALAGRDVPTERAFVMVAVMLIAVLFDRRALSLRSVAMAALVVLGLRPESLVSPGFQMSFAATVALVAAFGALGVIGNRVRRLPAWAAPAVMLVFSSFVAGMATAPYAAAHFNRIAEYGLIANLLAVPAMGILVMPGAVILALTAPLGLEAPALWMIEAGSRWILFVAERVAATSGAVSAVVRPPDAVVPLLTLGALWVILWRGWIRAAGLAPVAIAFALWAMADRPALLIAEDGGQIGVMTEAGRALAKPSGGFVTKVWLENDGDMASPETAGARALPNRGRGVTTAMVAGVPVVLLTGKGALAGLPAACAQGGLVIVAQRLTTDPPAGCAVLDARYLQRSGALAFWPEADGVRVVSAEDAAGQRMWTGAASPLGQASWAGMFGDTQGALQLHWAERQNPKPGRDGSARRADPAQDLAPITPPTQPWVEARPGLLRWPPSGAVTVARAAQGHSGLDRQHTSAPD